MKKNILWINHFLPYPPNGGVLIRTNSLIKEVSKHHNVTLVCLVQPRLVLPYFSSFDEGMKEISLWCRENNIKLHSFEIPSEKNKSGKYFVALKSLFSLKPYSVNWITVSSFKKFIRKSLNEGSFDIVHIDTMGLLDNIEEIENSPPTVINHHNAEHIMMRRRASKEKNIIKRLYYWMESKKIEVYDTKKMERLNNIKRHIACSEPDAEAIKSIYPKAVMSVVPNGVTFKKNVLRTPITGRFLFVGGLDWYPNTDAILYFLENVAPSLNNFKDQIKIDIVGKNPNQRIINLVNKFSFIELHGYVEDINAMYSKAQAFICPLRDGGGTKLKVLDAMMHGLPVIGSDIAFEGISVKDKYHGFVCNKDSEYISVIVEMIQSQNSEPYELIGSNARKLVEEKYNAQVIAHSYSKLLSDL